jgi:hypothetical protein
VEAGSIYVCIERGCVEAGAGATSGHLQRGGGGGLGPSPHLLGRMVAGWRQIQRDILMRFFVAPKEAVSVDDERTKGLL